MSREFHHHIHYTHNLTNNKTSDQPKFVELLFTRKSNIGWFYKAAMPTGWTIFFLMIIMDCFSLPFCRKNGYFQVNKYFNNQAL